MHLTRLLQSCCVVASVITSSHQLAVANMRAPLLQDGDLVEGPRAPDAVQDILLAHELLTLRLPRLNDDAPRTQIRVTAEYTLENSGPARELELEFFATDLDFPTVVVNSKPALKPVVTPMSQAQQEEFWAKQGALRQLSGSAMDRWRSQRFRGKEPVTARFKVALAAGTNLVRFSYEQEMLFWEHSPRYGSPRFSDGTAGFDYLLYPAKSWQMSPRFALEVQLEVPDLLEEGWLWDDYRLPLLSSTLPLKPTFSAKARSTTYSGRFTGFQKDILAVRIKWGEERD